MDTKANTPTFTDIKRFPYQYIYPTYCKAMLTGYAGISAEPKRGILQFPQAKHILWEENGWRVTDTYDAGREGLSHGTTRIYFEGVEVWYMQYGGRYDKEVTPFLKEALRFQFEICLTGGEFLGGRGPRKFHRGSLDYRNELNESTNHFFHGFEQISCEEVHWSGWHRYQGGLMI